MIPFVKYSGIHNRHTLTESKALSVRQELIKNMDPAAPDSCRKRSIIKFLLIDIFWLRTKMFMEVITKINQRGK